MENVDTVELLWVKYTSKLLLDYVEIYYDFWMFDSDSILVFACNFSKIE